MRHLGLTLLFFALGLAMPASAQTFGDNLPVAPVEPPRPQPRINRAAMPQLPFLPKARGSNADEDFFIPDSEKTIFDRPTADGTSRGRVAILKLDEKGRRQDVSKIFMYYDNFRISRSIGGLTTCDVRFYVNTNLNSRLISLDTKLVWPGLTTAVSFVNVEPNTPTYLDYTLMGDGCYSLDKMPNIIVNRCRVRGLSSAECAGKITWLKAVK